MAIAWPQWSSNVRTKYLTLDRILRTKYLLTLDRLNGSYSEDKILLLSISNVTQATMQDFLEISLARVVMASQPDLKLPDVISRVSPEETGSSVQAFVLARFRVWSNDVLVCWIAIHLRTKSRIALASTCRSNRDSLNEKFNYFDCSKCRSRLHYVNFPKKQRRIWLSFYNTLTLGDATDRRCYPCGVAAEADHINRRRQHHEHYRCICCCELLSEHPPPYNYLRNKRSRRDRLRCGRCLRDFAPFWSIELRQVCRSWESFGHAPLPNEEENRNILVKSWYSSRMFDFKPWIPTARILYLVIITIACSSTYRVPWSERTGLKKLALFLGPRFSRRYNPFGRVPVDIGTVNSNFCSRTFSMPARSLKWELGKNNSVVARSCCSPHFAGWFCRICNHQH